MDIGNQDPTPQNEMHRMGKGGLLELILKQGISKCVIAGGSCCFHFHYKGFSFCLSEIFGEGCQVERLDKLKQFLQDDKKINLSFPLFVQEREREPLMTGES